MQTHTDTIVNTPQGESLDKPPRESPLVIHKGEPTFSFLVWLSGLHNTFMALAVSGT